MKNTKLLRAIGGVDDRLIERAAPKKEAARCQRRGLRYAGLAACAALVIISLFVFGGEVADRPSGPPKGTLISSQGASMHPLIYSYKDLEQLALAKKKAFPKNYLKNWDEVYLWANLDGFMEYLENLDHYYIPVYAESRYHLVGIVLNLAQVTPIYSSIKPDHEYFHDFWLYMDREPDSESLMKFCIEMFDSKPWIVEGAYVEGVYYREYPKRDVDLQEGLSQWPEPGPGVTVFFWVQDGHYFELTMTEDVLNEIKANDHDALKGPLFELRKVELK